MAKRKATTKARTTSSATSSGSSGSASRAGNLFGDLSKGDVILKAAEVLAETLSKVLDEEWMEKIKPILGPLTALAVEEGIDVAEHVMVGLTQEDSYPHWQTLIAASDPETRLEIMEQTCQAAVEETMKRIERNKKTWEVLKIVLGVVGSLLLGLLA